MHDRHSGEPLAVQPIYGDAQADEVSGADNEDTGTSSSGEDVDAVGPASVRVLTWNINLQVQYAFVVEAIFGQER